MKPVASNLLVLGLMFSLSLSGTAAEQITRSDKLPGTTPWKLEALSEAPKFEWVNEEGSVRSMLFQGEPYQGSQTRVFAYYANPATLAGESIQERKWPAVVLVHGGGGTAFREWVELWAKRGYVAIAMDLAGHRPIEGKNAHQMENRERLADGGPNQSDEEKFGSVDKAADQQWSYHAVASVIRAHSLIRSFPEVDGERTAVTGISWGGYLTCIVAGLDNRFRAAVPVYGCGFLHENSAWLNRFAKMSPEQRQRWISLWDPSNYLPAVSMPIFFVNGTNDFAYPLDSYMASYKLVGGPKSIRVTVNMPHSHPDGWAPAEIGRFIDQHFQGDRAMAVIGDVRVENGVAHAKASAPIASSALHWTTGTGTINQREWQTAPASLSGLDISMGSFPAAPTAWFMTVTDDRGTITSSEVYFR